MFAICGWLRSKEKTVTVVYSVLTYFLELDYLIFMCNACLLHFILYLCMRWWLCLFICSNQWLQAISSVPKSEWGEEKHSTSGASPITNFLRLWNFLYIHVHIHMWNPWDMIFRIMIRHCLDYNFRWSGVEEEVKFPYLILLLVMFFPSILVIRYIKIAYVLMLLHCRNWITLLWKMHLFFSGPCRWHPYWRTFSVDWWI